MVDFLNTIIKSVRVQFLKLVEIARALPTGVEGVLVNRFHRKRQPVIGRIAAVTAPNFDADEFARATRPLEQKGFAVAVVSSTSGMLTGRTIEGQDVNFVPASTVGDMEFDGG